MAKHLTLSHRDLNPGFFNETFPPNFSNFYITGNKMYFLEIWSLWVHSNSWRRMCFANQYSQWENLCIPMDLVHFFDCYHIHQLYLRHDVSTITNSLVIFTNPNLRIFQVIFLLISVSTGQHVVNWKKTSVFMTNKKFVSFFNC